MSDKLSKEITEQIEQEAHQYAGYIPGCAPHIAWRSGATQYAEKWQASEQRAERAEKALNAILNTNHDNYEKVILKVKALANEALTKTSSDE